MYPYDTQQSIQDQLRNIANQVPQVLPNASTQKHVTRVKGIEGANAYNLAPNCDDILLDMDAPVIYFVMTDGAGYKTVTPYDITAHKVVTQEDTLKSIEERLAKLEEVILNGKSNNSATYTKPKSGNVRNEASNSSNDKG